MFYVQLAPLGGILGPLKSDLGLFWPFRAIYPRYLIFTKSSFKVWFMDGSWNFSPFSQSLHINEPPRLIWQAWQAHLGAEKFIFFKL
jgi:hypothetical protein